MPGVTIVYDDTIVAGRRFFRIVSVAMDRVEIWFWDPDADASLVIDEKDARSLEALDPSRSAPEGLRFNR